MIPVQVFVTCLADTFYPHIVRSMVSVLGKLGHTVTCPTEQTCCGQPMFNTGYFEQTRRAARHMIEVFSRYGDGVIVSPSASCTAMVRKHYLELFEQEPRTLEKARQLADRTYEFAEFLARVRQVNLGELGASYSGSVTYHYSCHFRSLGVTTEPIELIRQIRGIEYRELPRLEQCCGFGGTFAVKYPHISEAMVQDKLDCIAATGADCLIFSDAGCAMNILGAARRRGMRLVGMHLAELIDRSLNGKT